MTDDFDTLLRQRLARLAAAVPVPDRASQTVHVVVQAGRPTTRMAVGLGGVVAIVLLLGGVLLGPRLAAGPAASPAVTCAEPGTTWDVDASGNTTIVPVRLKCVDAIAAASAALGDQSSQVTAYDFRYGRYCPLDRRCPYSGDPLGHVIVTFRTAPSVVVSVKVDPSGAVVVTGIELKEALDHGGPTSSPISTEGVSPSPEITCEPDAIDCTAETQAVLAAVAGVAHPVTQIAFRADAMCIWEPFLSGTHSCQAIIEPDGTQHVTSAVVTFSGTDQQAFLNLFWLADGSISPSMALVTRPPGATPFQVLVTPSATLPNPGGTCSDSQFVLGTGSSGFTFSTALTRHAYLFQPLRNAGAACTLAVPNVIGVASANGPWQAASANDAGNEVCADSTCHYVTPPTYTIGAGQSLEIDFSVSWWVGANDANGMPLYSAPPCGGAVEDVSRVEFPVASGVITIDLQAATPEGGSSVPWHQVCSSPTSISFEIKTK
ncbi:MAG TPA: hypothetical protein VF494_05330 [Candidatus Limnocylindrales bacterium]